MLAVFPVTLDIQLSDLSLDEKHIEKVSPDRSDAKSQYLAGIGKQEESLISLLNIGSVIIEKEEI